MQPEGRRGGDLGMPGVALRNGAGLCGYYEMRMLVGVRARVVE